MYHINMWYMDILSVTVGAESSDVSRAKHSIYTYTCNLRVHA